MSITADIKVFDKLNNLELTKVRVFNETLQKKHYHNELSFAVVTKGSGKFILGNGSQEVKKGAIIKIASGDVHSSAASTEEGFMEYRVFYLADSAVNEILNREDQELFGSVSFQNHISYDTDFFYNCQKTHMELLEEEDTLFHESALTQLVLSLLKKYSHRSVKLPSVDSRPFYLQTVIDYLNAYYHEYISLIRLSHIVKKSPSQILRTFQKHVGISPHAYLMNLRVLKGKKLLAENESVAQTALLTGFSDQSHFHKHFKRIMHVTPGEFRKSLLN